MCSLLPSVTSLILHAADVHQHAFHQQTLMQLFITMSQFSIVNNSMTFDEILLDFRANEEDACTWPGISCTHSVVTSAYFADATPLIVDIEWAPPTLRHLHVRKSSFARANWTTETLPRNLRYLCIFRCAAQKDYGGSATLDLRRLPQRMEEKIVMHHRLRGELRFDDLPKSLRYLFIHTAPQLNQKAIEVFVDFALLPKALVSANVYVSGHKQSLKIVAAGGTKPDARVYAGSLKSWKVHQHVHRHSKMYRKLDAACPRIRKARWELRRSQ